MVMEEERQSRTSTSRTKRSSSMERRRRKAVGWPLVLVAALCFSGSWLEVARACAIGITTPGHTWPSGDIVMEHDKSPLHIECVLNQTHVDLYFPGKNSSDLVFFKGNRPADPETVRVVNKTSIALSITNPPPQNVVYYCKLRLDNKTHGREYEAVCLNKVVVGYKPSEPDNFKCVSRNWENLTCAWDPPQNYIKTKYSLTFKLAGRAGGRQMFACPELSVEPGQPVIENTCTWDQKTDPIYRQPYEYYTFNLTGENVLGSWSKSYRFHHFANVIPNRPVNLTVVNKTLTTAMLHWTVGFPMQTFPPGLFHKIEYQSEWDDSSTWKVIKHKEDPRNKEKYFNLTGLNYANAIYDVRVFMASASATGDDKWSNFSDVTFRTLPQIPGQSPRSDVGSFEIMENNVNRDIYLYWQTIPPWLENGMNFTYKVFQVDERGKRSSISLEATELSRSYAKFRGLGHLTNYWFEIASSNEVGDRSDPAKIFIPSRTTIPKEPVAFTKIAFEDGLFELSWKPPINGDEAITNYTIFWCENDKDRPYQCMGYLDWVHVPKAVSTYNVTVPRPEKVYQFAIAANTKYSSSGMMWASCTVIHNKVVGKMKTVWINRIGSTVIEVGWKLDCSDRIGIVEGFKIYYCPIVSPYNNNCKGPKMNTTIKADLNTIRGEVRGLKPYTTYMIAVSVLSKNGEGQYSDPLYNTTLESPPSNSPSDIMVQNVTNSTMFIEWTKPLNMNGVLRYYIVYYNEYSKNVEEVSHVELTDLLPNTNYTIRVAACTVECSVKSPPIHVMTEIGVPSKISPPIVRFVNSSQVRVLWDKPMMPAGPLNYYQVMSSDGEIQNTTTLESSLLIPDCNAEGKEKLYKFQVRAVNVDEKNEHLYGNWSDAGEGNCFSNGPSYGVWVLIWIIGSISGIAFVFCVAYTSKRLWMKCKAMQDIEVKLPPGLAPNMKLLEKGDQHSRHPSADSIGRNSNPESITSSLTTHHSCVSTDSGAELDMSPNQVATDTSNSDKSDQVWESASMRQKSFNSGSKTHLVSENKLDPYSRIVAGSSEMIIASAMTADSKSLTRSTPNLSDHLGYGTANQTWTSTGYISMPSSEEMSENSSSPVPKENMNPAHYSVVSTTSTPMRYKNEDVKGSLSNSQNETQLKPTVNPYISLMALEQKSKDSKKQVMDSFQILNDLNFTSASQITPQEKPSKPYVQTCFLDIKAPPLGTFDPRQMIASQPSPSAYFAQSSLAQDLTNKLSSTPASSTKPYVTIASLAETQQLQQKKPVATVLPNIITSPVDSHGDLSKGYIPENSFTEGENKAGDVRPVSPAFLMPQQNLSLDSTEKIVNNDDQKITSSHYSIMGRGVKNEESRPSSSCSSSSSGYTLCLKPDEKQASSQVGSTPSAKVSGYVTLPEQKSFGKPLPQHQVTGSNEQYSKVAVLPRTIH